MIVGRVVRLAELLGQFRGLLLGELGGLLGRAAQTRPARPRSALPCGSTAGKTYAKTKSWSARYRSLVARQSTIGSLNPPTCPDASQTFGFMMIEQSSPTMSSRIWTLSRHQASLMFRFSSTPSGP